VGLAVLDECGIEAAVKAGAMLYRVGSHRKRDTLKYALPNNFGGYYDGWLVGHAWNQVGDEIVDFSAGDWAEDVEPVGPDDGLGPIQWELDPPDFIWQPAKTLPRWRSSGVPNLGDVWYGPWGDPRPPPTTTLAEDDRRILEQHREIIEEMVAESEIRKRLGKA
jgi:hypothetical protein